MENQTEAIEETKATCGLVLSGTLRDFATLKRYAESLGMRIIYQRSTAPWNHLIIATDEQIRGWSKGDSQ